MPRRPMIISRPAVRADHDLALLRELSPQKGRTGGEWNRSISVGRP